MAKTLTGDLATVADELKSSPKGRMLGMVLVKLKTETGNAKVTVSTDQRRAILTLGDGTLAAVRVAPFALSGPRTTTPRLRFKRPGFPHKFRFLYFGGLTPDGVPFVKRFTPAELGPLQTISIRMPD